MELFDTSERGLGVDGDAEVTERLRFRLTQVQIKSSIENKTWTINIKAPVREKAKRIRKDLSGRG